MADLTRTNNIGGDAFHIRDSYIWAEIYYLDSPSDYREYLPHNQLRRESFASADLTMLDSSKQSKRTAENRPSGWALPIFFGLLALFLFWSIVCDRI